jgi:uncharacterized protein (DUF2141 family)
MKKIFLALGCSLFTQIALAMPVTIKVTNTGYQEGQIVLAVFNSRAGYDNSKAFKEVILPLSASVGEGLVEVDLPPGDYVVTTFFDTNFDRILNTRFGIPRERFGASNNPQNLGAPAYDYCLVRLDDQNQKISIKLRKIF